MSIKVKSTGEDNKVLLWEVDDRHPGGEVFVKNNGKTIEVGETPRINALIAEGALKRDGGAKKS